MSASKIQRLPGMAAPGQHRYPKPYPAVKSWSEKVWRPVAGTNLNMDSVAVFDLKVPSDSLIRFGDNPFHLRFNAEYPNPAQDKEAAPDTEQGSALHYVMPQGVKDNNAPLPLIYLESTLQAQSFFSKLDVDVNMSAVPGPELGEHGGLYQGANRILGKDPEITERYGKTYRISTTAERSYDVTSFEPSDRIHAAMETLQMDGKKTSKRLISTFNFDGMFPFASQSNVTRALTGNVIPNGFLPPECQLKLTLHKRVPIDSYIERPLISDRTYHDPNAVAAEQLKITITMLDLYVVYEVAVLETTSKAGHYKKGGKYYVDIPRLRFENVAGGMGFTQNKAQIPAGTTAVLIFWVVQEQLFYNGIRHKNLSNRYTFLPNCINIKLKLEDHSEPLIFSEGLADAGSDKAYSSGSCRAYHKYLIQAGLYGRDFTSMFPRAGGSYDQILVVDLRKYDIRKPTHISVDILYNAESSPAKHQMVYVTLQQGCYTYHDGGALQLDYVV